MTFKKLLKEAAKVDPSTFKVGPKVKVQPRVPEKGRPVEKPKVPAPPISTTTSVASPSLKIASGKSPAPKPMSPVIPGGRPAKSVVERALSSASSWSVSPLGGPRPSSMTKKTKPSLSKSIASAHSTMAKSSSLSTNAKSRLRDSFIPNELIPLAQGPRRDLRTIEEIQNDLWRKKGKNYPSVTGQSNSAAPRVRSPVLSPHKHLSPLKSDRETKKKRPREDDEQSEDSFIVSENEDEDVPEIDYRAEI